MPAKELPLNTDSMVTDGGMGYFMPDPPDSDASSTEGVDQFEVLGAPASMPAPMQVVSIATEAQDAPGNEQTWNSGDKGTNWMGGSTLPWER